jgi:SAM-dependent methyltransferase
MAQYFNFFRGIHYRNQWFYYLQNALKLGTGYSRRFKIAAEHLNPGESVLDVCAGPGELHRYLPTGCSYNCIEASPQFVQILKRKNFPVVVQDLHEGLKAEGLKADTAVMIVSLCHFRNTAAAEILETLKKIAGRVIVVEDVLAKARGEHSFRQKMMNYCCQTDYYRPIGLFTAAEFGDLMRRHGYACRRFDDRYSVGCYPGEKTAD